MLRHALVSLAVALVATPACAIPAPAPVIDAQLARPALWVVGDDDTIIYLFGTFHALDDRIPWFDHAVRAAFEGSDELVLETLVPDSPEAFRAALARYRPSATPAAGLMGAHTAMTAARSVGLSARNGADEVLQRAAVAERKPVIGLEKFEAQLAMYDRLPGRTLAPASTSAAATPDPAVAAFMRQLVAAWTSGDPRTFEAVVDAVQAQSPESYQLLFAERNATWANWISERLKQPGIVFVAVGTGHLVGRDSVQAQLAAHGIRSARVN
ncbi:TraB/GumN family protein [Sphingomonas sp. KRR8]|uniref:TraB/GumN family protein n=1 Tax=Sphingomonas sp. KRR8 TaxID=2942996 RepID=UPI002020A7E3|nr:TraB/GumN family protein [Sphingomonas sp. KRR8]URD61953.1 TraB/GumN family protein [Sphingomonas sp. KRR8]